MNSIKPLKRFGQNYLTDRNTILKIVEVISPDKYDHVLEIGPGKGSLTKELIKLNSNVTCFEIDNRVIDLLKNDFPEIEIINDDFLKVDLADYIKTNEKTIICGNIPYNITSPILFKIINNSAIVTDVVLMMQNEVAQRLIAKPRTKEYGILSVIHDYFAFTEYCFKIPPTVFYPRPKVDSAIIKIRFKEIKDDGTDNQLFIRVVKAAFGNRRKTLKNSLSNSIFASEKLFNSGFDFTRRAEELNVEDYLKLTGIIKNIISQSK